MSFFSLSRTWGKISLRGHYCSSLTVLQHSFLAELCKRALRALYQNFSTWLLTWLLASHLTMSITFHPSLPPIPRPAKPPASTGRLLYHILLSYCLEVKATSHTSPACVQQLLLLSEIPEARCSWWVWHTVQQQLLWPIRRKRSPITELCFEMSGEESSCKSSTNKNPTRTHNNLSGPSKVTISLCPLPHHRTWSSSFSMEN